MSNHGTRRSAGSADPPSPVALADLFQVGDLRASPFELRRRSPLLPTGVRLLMGLVLAIPIGALALTGFAVDDGLPPLLKWASVAGVVLWIAPLSALFVPRSWRTGMLPMRASLELRTAPGKEAADLVARLVALDGVAVGAVADASVRLYDSSETSFSYNLGHRARHLHVVCLLLGRRAYEILCTAHQPVARELAEALETVIHGTSGRIHEKKVGPPDWPGAVEINYAMVSFFLAGLAALFVLGMRKPDAVAPSALLLGVTGVCAFLARASTALLLLGKCASAQRGTFAKRFDGASPVHAPGWLSARGGMAVFVAAHLALALLVAVCLAQLGHR